MKFNLKSLVVVMVLVSAMPPTQAAAPSEPVVCGQGNKAAQEKVMMSYLFHGSNKNGPGGNGMIFTCMGKGEIDTEEGVYKLISIVEKKDHLTGVIPMFIKVLSK